MSSDKAHKSFPEVYREKYSDDKDALPSVIRKLGWILYQPYKWFFLVPLLLVTTIILSTGALILAVAFNPKTGGVCGTLWSRINSFFTPMIVRVHGSDRIEKNRSYVIVANHLSLYDIYVLYGWLGIDFRWVMKQELRKIPFIGYSCELLEHIYIDRSNSDKAIETLKRAKERIKDGTSIIFFPEGSRSYDGKLKEFKKGAFKMALELDLPVLPVTINGTQNVLPKGTVNLQPGAVDLIINEPIDTKDYKESTLKDLIDEAHRRISSGL